MLLKQLHRLPRHLVQYITLKVFKVASVEKFIENFYEPLWRDFWCQTVETSGFQFMAEGWQRRSQSDVTRETE